MRRYLFFFTIVCAAAVWCSGAAPVKPRAAIADSIRGALASVEHGPARLALLYDLFDLAPKDSVNFTGEAVLREALRINDLESAMDMYRRLASFNSAKDTIRVRDYINELRRFPASGERDATEMFMELCMSSGQASFADEQERYEQIMRLLRMYRNKDMHTSSINERVLILFSLCNYLDMSLPNEVLSAYLSELDKLLKQMPYPLDGLQNLYYQRAAMAYTNNGQGARAVVADRQLLDVIDRLDRDRLAKGHRFRNYDKYRYTVYRRMLSNSEALSPTEVDEIYANIKTLATKNDEIAEDMKTNPRAEVFYLMAKKRYAEALPLLQKCLASEKRPATRRLLLHHLVEAAKQTSNAPVLTEASLDYAKLLEETLRERTTQRGHELSALYEITQHMPEDAPQEDPTLSAQPRTVMLVGIGAGVVILLVIGLFTYFIIRDRRLSRNLKNSNELLVTERDNLKKISESLIQARDEARNASRHKSDFISNMSHEVTTPLNAIVECSHLIVDNVSSEKRKYLERFARTIDISADLLRTLVSDVLEINNLEGGDLAVQRSTVTVHTICTAAIESVRIHAKPGVSLEWEDNLDNDHTIYTDPRRVEQVLVNLLSNGLKFTEKGFVRLASHVDTEAGIATFTVTDSGIGVPVGKEEQIFTRFEKLSPMTQGSGLGLSICRMLATSLGGKVYVDTSYREAGTRFIFTIPSMP